MQASSLELRIDIVRLKLSLTRAPCPACVCCSRKLSRAHSECCNKSHQRLLQPTARTKTHRQKHKIGMQESARTQGAVIPNERKHRQTDRRTHALCPWFRNSSSKPATHFCCTRTRCRQPCSQRTRKWLSRSRYC